MICCHTCRIWRKSPTQGLCRVHTFNCKCFNRPKHWIAAAASTNSDWLAASVQHDRDATGCAAGKPVEVCQQDAICCWQVWSKIQQAAETSLQGRRRRYLSTFHKARSLLLHLQSHSCWPRVALASNIDAQSCTDPAQLEWPAFM